MMAIKGLLVNLGLNNLLNVWIHNRVFFNRFGKLTRRT